MRSGISFLQRTLFSISAVVSAIIDSPHGTLVLWLLAIPLSLLFFCFCCFQSFVVEKEKRNIKEGFKNAISFDFFVFKLPHVKECGRSTDIYKLPVNVYGVWWSWAYHYFFYFLLITECPGSLARIPTAGEMSIVITFWYWTFPCVHANL